MIPLTFQDVEKWTGGKALHCPLERMVSKLTIDSREGGPDVLFVALPGTNTDGHAFVEEVWRLGGVALVKEDFSDQRGAQIRVRSPLEAMGQLMRQYLALHQVKVVGVTGSVGKTSVKELSLAVLRRRFVTSGSLGNYNTAIGLPLSFFAGSADTTHFVAEMGMSAPDEIRRLTQISPPDVAVITTIGSSHLEKLGSMRAIQAAKGEILEGLKPDGTAVLNHDNPWTRELGERHGRVRWFGYEPGLDARVVESKVFDDSTVIRIAVAGQSITVRLPWLGIHHGLNVAAALLVGQELGVDLAEAAHGIETIDRSRSRIRVVLAGGLTLLEDVYNASPLSVKAALDVLGSRSGRRVAVLGDMLELGDEEQSGHRQVGAYAKGAVDWLLAVGERSSETYLEARSAGVPCHWVSTRHEALGILQQQLKDGDVVLLKASRGMQFEWLAEQLEEWGRAQ